MKEKIVIMSEKDKIVSKLLELHIAKQDMEANQRELRLKKRQIEENLHSLDQNIPTKVIEVFTQLEKLKNVKK